jgi:uncharacterized protein (DUF58 family)
MNTKNLLLKAKKQVYGDRLGNHATKFQGEGFEFSELREYMYGDDVRKIDWKSTAKTGKTYIKVYNEERELNVIVATMMGGSTYFGTTRQKCDVMREIVALLGSASLAKGDKFTHYLFASKLIAQTKPSKRFYSLYMALEELNTFEPLGHESRYDIMHRELDHQLKRKALLYIISDFIGDIDFASLSQKHDVVFVIVRDRYEENPEELGFIGLVDMESGVKMVGDINEGAIKTYKKALHENDTKLASQCMKYGIRTIKVYTDDDIFLALKRGMEHG